MQDVEAITKGKTNQQQNYKFRGIDDMYNALHPLFKKHSVFITSNVLESKREERQTAKGGFLMYSIIKVCFRFYTTDGTFIESIIEGEAMDSGDKATNKALSTALKYALMQMFLIPTDEKIDTEYQSPEPLPKVPELPNVPEQYTKQHSDALYICDLIQYAANTESLRMLSNMNTAFFVANPEIKEKLIKKGLELKAKI